MNADGSRTPVLPRDRTTPAAGASASCRCDVSGLLGEGEQLSRNTGDSTAVLQICCTHAWLSLLQGQPEQIVTIATPLLDNPKGDLFFRLTLRERVAQAWIELGDVSSAVTAARDVVESARENGFSLVETWTLPTLGCALARQKGIRRRRERHLSELSSAAEPCRSRSTRRDPARGAERDSA